MVHGSAGSTAFGATKNLWRRPASAATSTCPAQPRAARAYRDYLTIVSNTDVRNAEAFTPPEIGGDHFRSSAVYLTQSHPKQTAGSDVRAGHLARSVLRADVRTGHADPVDAALHRERRSGRRLRLRLLVRVHRLDQLGVAGQPLPMVRDPRAVFDQLFGVGATPDERARRRRRTRAFSTAIPSDGATEAPSSAPPTAPGLARYLDDIREIERRIQNVEAQQRERRAARAARGAGRRARLLRRAREADVRPPGAPPSRRTSRACSRSRWRATSRPRLPARAASTTGFHISSHHRRRSRRIREFAKINRYHVSLMPYFLEKLKRTPTATAPCSTTRSSSTARRWATPNVHNHKRCPLFFAGHAGGRLKGGLHLRARRRHADGQRRC